MPFNLVLELGISGTNRAEDLWVLSVWFLKTVCEICNGLKIRGVEGNVLTITKVQGIQPDWPGVVVDLK